VLYKEDLDKMGCGVPDCGHDHGILYLHAKCHLQAGLTVSYIKDTEVLRIACAQCGTHVMSVAVASLEEEDPMVAVLKNKRKDHTS